MLINAGYSGWQSKYFRSEFTGTADGTVLVNFQTIKTIGMKTGMLGLMLLVFAGMHFPDGDLDRIGLAIQTGNSKELSKYFDNTVEITIGENEETYSKAQAEMVLKDFFTKNRPASFKLIHNGTSQGLQYGIGILITDKGSYRSTIFLKPKGTGNFIQEIRFEKE